MTNLELEKQAVKVRRGIIDGVHAAKAGHPGGSLSAAEVFTYLYFEEMNIDPKDPKKPDRDRFVLSKGHTAPGLLRGAGQPGLFPGGGSSDPAPHRLPSPGTSLCTAHAGSGRCPADLWAREFPSRWAWRCPRSSAMRTTVYTRFWATARSRRDRCGRHPCLRRPQKLDNLCVIVDNNGLQIDGHGRCGQFPLSDSREV